jgi:hypothetical protein
MSQDPPVPGYPSQYPQPGQQPGYPPQGQPGQQPGYPPQGQPGQQPGYPPQGQPAQQPGYPPQGQPAQQPGYGYPPTAPQPMGQPEVLGSYGSVPPPPQPQGGRTKMIVVGASAAAAVLVIGGGVFAYNVLSGNATDQPEKHVPASTAMLATLDLDPSLSQKADAVRFASKFPGSSFKESEDPRKSIWEEITKDSKNAPAWSEVEPWMGNRGALAVLPSPKEASKATAVFVLAVTDEGKASTTLKRLEDVGVAVGDGWAYLAEEEADATAALEATRKGTLSDDAIFAQDVKKLGEDGIADVWFDGKKLSAFKDMLKDDEDLSKLVSGSSAIDISGHGAMALRFSGTSLEMSGTFTGFKNALPASGTSGVEDLPADTLGAIGVSGLGDQLVKSWPDITKALGSEASESMSQIEQQTGIKLPEDLKTLLGTSIAVAVGPEASGGTPAVALRVRTKDSSRGVLDKVTKLLDDAGATYSRKDFSDGYVLSTSQEQAAAAAKGKGLAGSARFTEAVPDFKGAGIVAYADVTALMKTYGSSMPADDRKNIEPLDAFGMSVRNSGDDSFTMTLRVTTR